MEADPTDEVDSDLVEEPRRVLGQGWADALGRWD
jgi:hypothetical protein